MKQDVIPQQKRGAKTADLPKKFIVPPPKDPTRCEGCPYPSVGFICWSPDGSCMRTDVEKFSRRSRMR